MTTLLWTVAAVSLAWLVGYFVWRTLSRRYSLPCPTLFAPALGSRVFEKLLWTETTLDRIGFCPGQRVLEIGPGPGRLLVPAAKRILPDGEATGIDIQRGMIDRLQRRVDSEDLRNVTAIVGDATTSIVTPETFDVVFLCTTLGEIPDRDGVLRQCFEALKSAGILSITEIFLDPHYQTQRSVLRLASQTGFELEQIEGNWMLYSARFTKPVNLGNAPPSV